MITKIQLSESERATLAAIFVSELTQTKVWQRMGSTTKALAQEAIRLNFIPFKDVYTEFPLIECDHLYEKDEQDNVTRDEYVFELKLVFPFLEGFEIKMKKTLPKSALETR